MKKLFIVILSMALLAACAPAVKPMYYWGNYSNASDKFLKRSTDKDLETLKANYEDIIAKEAKGTRAVPPPGVCADYGFLLLQAGENQKGMDLLKKEIALYPESKVFIERILKAFENAK